MYLFLQTLSNTHHFDLILVEGLLVPSKIAIAIKLVLNSLIKMGVDVYMQWLILNFLFCFELHLIYRTAYS